MKLYTIPRLSWFHFGGRKLQLVTIDGKYAHVRDWAGSHMVMDANTEVEP